MAFDKLCPAPDSCLGPERTSDDMSTARAKNIQEARGASPAWVPQLAGRKPSVPDAARTTAMTSAQASVGTARLNRLVNPPVGADRRPPSDQPAETLPIGATEVTRGPVGGQPLDTNVRRSLERAFEADLGAVRVRTGPEAKAAAELLSARAFTSGAEIFLGPGESSADPRLIAHEVAHIIRKQPAQPHV